MALLPATWRAARAELSDERVGVIDVRDYGALGQDVNYTAELQAAFDAAAAARSTVYIPIGLYRVHSTLTYKAPIYGQIGHTSGYDYTKGVYLLGEMTDGSPVLHVPGGNPWGWDIRDIVISNAYSSNPSDARNYTGLLVGNGFGSLPATLGYNAFAPNGYMSNVRSRGGQIGFDIQGFCQTFENIWAESNVLGFRGEYLNASKIDLQLVSNAQGMIVESSGAMAFSRLFEETPGPYRTASSLIDNCDGLTIVEYYGENDLTPAALPWIKVGSKAAVQAGPGNSGICYDFKMLGGFAGHVASGVQIEIDRADGFYIGLEQNLDGLATLYSTTANSLGDCTTTTKLQTYTPTLTASTTNPTLGSTVLTGRWSRSGHIVTVWGTINITTGGAWNAGSGIWRFSMPVKPNVAGPVAYAVGSVKVFRNGVAHYNGVCQLNPVADANGVAEFYIDVGSAPLTHAGPGGAWATDDALTFCITYATV